MLYSRLGFTSFETAPMKKPPMLKGRSDPVFDLLTKSPHKERRKPEQRSTPACCSPGVLRVNDDVVVQDGKAIRFMFRLPPRGSRLDCGYCRGGSINPMTIRIGRITCTR